MKRHLSMLVGLALVAAACGDTADETTTTAPPETTTTAAAEGPATAPSEIVFEAQTSDGTTIVVASVTLPSPGFVGVHGNADGAPGPIIGHSELLPAGTSTDVMVTLDEPLTQTDLVWPMVHIDMNSNGVYEFFPPDLTIDLPGVTADGTIAVVSGEVTVEDAQAAPATAPSEIVFEAQTSDGTTIVIASVTLPSPGFVGVHGNADGAPGPIIGHSELLPAGTSTDVMVTLDEPLTQTDLVWPMVHIDMNSNGVYEFFPPDLTIDLPGVTADGTIAVVSGEVTVGS